MPTANPVAPEPAATEKAICYASADASCATSQNCQTPLLLSNMFDSAGSLVPDVETSEFLRGDGDVHP